MVAQAPGHRRRDNLAVDVRTRRAEAVAALRRAGVPAVPVSAANDRARDPRFGECRVAPHIPDWVKGFPMILHGHTTPDPTPAPVLGDNAELLDDDAIDELLRPSHGKPPGNKQLSLGAP